MYIDESYTKVHEEFVLQILLLHRLCRITLLEDLITKYGPVARCFVTLHNDKLDIRQHLFIVYSSKT